MLAQQGVVGAEQKLQQRIAVLLQYYRHRPVSMWTVCVVLLSCVGLPCMALAHAQGSACAATTQLSGFHSSTAAYLREQFVVVASAFFCAALTCTVLPWPRRCANAGAIFSFQPYNHTFGSAIYAAFFESCESSHCAKALCQVQCGMVFQGQGCAYWSVCWMVIVRSGDLSVRVLVR